MLEKPDLDDSKIIDCLRDEYGLAIAEVTFLPLGADVDSAVYRAVSDQAAAYFVKLRSGHFDETTVTIPKLLHDQGIRQIIAPLATRTQALWADLDEYKLTVSPYVAGQDAYALRMTDAHWVQFGAALEKIHRVDLPQDIKALIPGETFTPQWREAVRRFQAMADETDFADPVAAEMAAFLKAKADTVSELVRQAEQLGALLQSQSPEYVLCHADIHAGNILMTENGQLYIVDWDTLILAPKERDLMFVGGGLFGGWRSAEDEEALFYQGYGPASINPIALAYYRYERIVQDIAAYCEEILLTEGDSEDRTNGLRQLMSQFQPGAVVELAYRTA